MKNIKNYLLFGAVGVLAGCASGGSKVVESEGDSYRRTGHVVWNKQDGVSAEALMNRRMPPNSASVFFLRPLDDDGLETSANIAVNGRFQVSLQPGAFSHVYTCTGINDLSADVTGRKHNDLKRGLASYPLEAGQHYFFGVDVEGGGMTQIRKVPQDVALNAMREMKRQTHQVSRVVPNCAPAPARIELNVLFDTNKAIVKSQYYSEIERVAAYMKKHTNTTAVLEGHTDSRASDSYNMGLSQRRVNAVMDVLVNRYGVDSSRLKAIGYGERRPIAPNDSPANMQKNRRVVAVFSNK